MFACTKLLNNSQLDDEKNRKASVIGNQNARMGITGETLQSNYSFKADSAVQFQMLTFDSQKF